MQFNYTNTLDIEKGNVFIDEIKQMNTLKQELNSRKRKEKKRKEIRGGMIPVDQAGSKAPKK